MGILGPSGGGNSTIELITSVTASEDSSVEFTGLTDYYSKYIIVFGGVTPSTDNSLFIVRTSSDGGSTYDSSAGNYAWSHRFLRMNGSVTESNSGSDSSTYINPINLGLGNDVGEEASGEIEIFYPSLSCFTHIDHKLILRASNASYYHCRGAGIRLEEEVVDAIQLSFISSNIATGTFKLYGVKA